MNTLIRADNTQVTQNAPSTTRVKYSLKGTKTFVCVLHKLRLTKHSRLYFYELINSCLRYRISNQPGAELFKGRSALILG